MARVIRTTNPPRNPQRAGFVRKRNTAPYVKTSNYANFQGQVPQDRAKWSNFNPINRAERAPWVQYAGNGNGMQAGMGGMDVSQYVMGLASVGILFFIIGWGYAEGRKYA